MTKYRVLIAVALATLIFYVCFTALEKAVTEYERVSNAVPESMHGDITIFNTGTHKKRLGVFDINDKAACKLTNNEIHVYFPNRIDFTRRELVKFSHTLQKAKVTDKVILHLDGYGGRVDNTQMLLSAIQNTDACVETHVEGPVYSAHAILSVAGDRIMVTNNGLFMFHRSSLYGNAEQLCKSHEGRQDRTQSAKDKCHKMYEALIKLDRKMMIDLLHKVLSADDLKAVLDGHDVYITKHGLLKQLQEFRHAG